MKAYYGCVFSTLLKGKLAIQIPVEYEFFGSGVIMQPRIEAQVWGMYPLEFIFNHGQDELAKAFNVKQQSISRYLKDGQYVQELFSSGSYSEKDIWGYSPTERRRQENGLVR